MADINSNSEAMSRAPRTRPTDELPANAPQRAPELVEADLFKFVELLFFAYRDFTGEPDALLDDFGFGRAHHRVIHFVHRNPGLRVADLLDILKITKQSLSRVLKQLIDDGFIVQEAGVADRRERHLFATERGRSLAKRLAALQVQRIQQALAAAGPGAPEAVEKFLLSVVSPHDRAAVRDVISKKADAGRP